MEGQWNQKKNNQISRTKALGIISLLAALLIFQIVTFIISKTSKQPKLKLETKEIKYFNFNPNTISIDSLSLLGFTPKQAESISRYREKGGTFKEKSDFAKIYVVSKEKFIALAPYIILPDKKTFNNNKHKNNYIKEVSYKKDRNEFIKNKYTNTQESFAKNEYKNLKKARALCNINLADSATFTQLYGIGAFYAKKIIEYRQRLGGSFAKKEQLMEIYGIDSIRFYGFYEQLSLDSTDIIKFSFSELSLRFMESHPYIGPWRAKKIAKYREENGKDNCTIEQLISLGIFTPQNANKISPYIK